MGKRTQLVLLLPLALLLFVMHQPAGVGAQLTIGVTTMNPPSGVGTPNTFIGTGNQIASALLGSATPALMWGVVSSEDVLLKSAFGITAIRGCLAASDGSGTQAVMLDNTGRQSAVVCPSNAGSTGCAVYLTGDDVTSLYNQGACRRLLSSRKLVDAGSDCQTGAAQGAISGAVTGVLSISGCLGLGPLAPFCIAGVFGASAALGAAGGCAGGAATSGGSCFPGDATVSLASSEVKRMTALALGDKVAVRMDGGLAYEEVYAFGHRDAMAVAEFVQVSLEPINSDNMTNSKVKSRTLELSTLHFAPVSAGPEYESILTREGSCPPQEMLEKCCSSAVRTSLSVTKCGSPKAHEATMFVVTSISRVEKEGLYNPFTLAGTIIVNGVAASTHSDWFLDTTFESLGIDTNWLPAAYQMVLFPVRTLYRVLGKDLYLSIYHRLDALVNIAEVGTTHGGSIVTRAGAIFAMIAALLLSKLVANTHGQKRVTSSLYEVGFGHSCFIVEFK